MWGLLLGNKLDRIPPNERTTKRLVQKFCENKKEIVRFHHKSVADLTKTLLNSSTEEAENTLMFLWAEYEWRNKATGKKFVLDNDLSSELDRIEDEGNIVYRLNESFCLVWSGKEIRRPVFESDEVLSRTETEAKPIFIREKSSDAVVEVRGTIRLLDAFSEDFSDKDEVDEVEPEPTEEPILENLSKAFELDMSTLTLTEAKFNTTNLPNRSSLTIKNNEGVQEDIKSSNLQPKTIDTDSLSDLEFLKFHHEKTGLNVKMKVVRENQGFYLHLDDSNLPEEEKKSVRNLIEERLDVSFESLYPYDVQHHREYIINMVLTGDIDTYRKYYDNLDTDVQEFIDEFTDVSGQSVFVCYDCHEPYVEPDGDLCPECGNYLMRGEGNVEIDIKEKKIQTEISKKFKNLGEDIRASDGTRLLQTKFEPDEINDNQYVKANFQMAELAGSAMDNYWCEFFVYPLGNGHIPKRVNEYLLDCVLVTYGKSGIHGRDHFGELDLYGFLEGESPEVQFADAVRESRSRLRNRVREEATQAQDRLQQLQAKVDNDAIEDVDFDEINELRSEYDYNDFEQDVFYLLKSMFLFTERWGREGKKETDGCLIVPDDGEYFVGTYDPKLTYDMNGYNLNSSEKNKAAYYILSENDRKYISDVLKDGGTIDSHIFVSNNFREGQFGNIVETVRDWFSLVEGNSGELDTEIVFLPVKSLLGIYDIFSTNYDYIMEYSGVQHAFRSGVTSQFSFSGGHSVIDDESVEELKEGVLEARSMETKKKSSRDYSSE